MTILYSIPLCSITFYSVLLHYSIISCNMISYYIVLYPIIILYDILLFYTLSLYHIVLFHIPTYSSSRVLSKYTSQGMHVFCSFLCCLLLDTQLNALPPYSAMNIINGRFLWQVAMPSRTFWCSLQKAFSCCQVAFQYVSPSDRNLSHKGWPSSLEPFSGIGTLGISTALTEL